MAAAEVDDKSHRLVVGVMSFFNSSDCGAEVCTLIAKANHCYRNF